MAGRNEIQQTIERILNLTADHINVSDGKLCFNIIGIVGSGGTHLTHVRIGGTGQQQRLRTLAGGTRIVRIGFKHLLVRGCGASVIALLCQHIRLLMLRRHLLLALAAEAEFAASEFGSPEYGAEPVTPACCAAATRFGITVSTICCISSADGKPCKIGIGRPLINANNAGAPCTWNACAIEGFDAISIRDS